MWYKEEHKPNVDKPKTADKPSKQSRTSTIWNHLEVKIVNTKLP